MPRFIFMLTCDDRTVLDAEGVYDRIAHTALRCVGIKDIGLPAESLRALVRAVRRDGREVMLEVVSTDREGEQQSIESAARNGVDCVLGGRYPEEAVQILRGTGVRYYPFAGETVGHPTVLTGTTDEIVDDARRLATMPGVHGIDLLAYRFAGNVPDLVRRVVQGCRVPVIAAGSIDTHERVAVVRDAGVWAFTIGSAIFDGSIVGDDVAQRIESILALEGVEA